MVAATSGAVLNGLGSYFSSGGSKNQTFWPLTAIEGKVGVAISPRRLIVVAAAAPKKSWLPGVRGGCNLVDPDWLDGSLPGDYGFDPLGLGNDPALLRWAMAAVVGIFVEQAWSGVPWLEAGADPQCNCSFLRWFSSGNPVASYGWIDSKKRMDFFNQDSLSVEWVTSWSRTAENFANVTGEQGYLGGKFFDILGFTFTITDGVYILDTVKLERLKLTEIKHVRITMLAMLSFYRGRTKPLLALLACKLNNSM